METRPGFIASCAFPSGNLLINFVLKRERHVAYFVTTEFAVESALDVEREMALFVGAPFDAVLLGFVVGVVVEALRQVQRDHSHQLGCIVATQAIQVHRNEASLLKIGLGKLVVSHFADELKM